MKLRPANIDDIAKLLNLMIDTIKYRCRQDYNQDQINAWISSAQRVHHWHQFIEQQHALVAELGDEIVGFASLENGAHVYFMYVNKDYFGQGIATRLYEALETESIKRGNDKITADVSITARLFFEAKGFKVLKENNNQINQISLINYSMIKSLTIEKRGRKTSLKEK